ncbi:hypothetical protein niasHS_001616 [Heterodera schachtii]|uniref:Uncharacterized protein n=1 Tax=Heterodera schachtii TaxID=97005 RepID=A0ABD2KE85_HETSC
MSTDNGAAANVQPEQDEKLTAQPEQTAGKTASPVKKATESDLGTGEESRDSVQSVGQESAEGDEEEDEAGDEEETDEEHPAQQTEEKGINGHEKAEKSVNGHEKVGEKTAVNGVEKAEEKGVNGHEKAEPRKRINNEGPEEADTESSQQKKQRMDGEQAAEKEVAAE